MCQREWDGQRQRSQSRVHRLRFQGKHGEDGLMYTPERLAAHEALQRLDAQGELTDGEAALGVQPTLAQAIQIRRLGVVGAVDDAQVLAAAALDGGLDEAALAAHDELQWLDDHALTAAA